MSTAFIVKFLTIAGGLAAGMPATEKPCHAKIEKEIRNGHHFFSGVFHNHLDERVEGTYSLDAIREGKSGRSVSRQSGSFKAGPFDTTVLSCFSVNIEDGDAYTVVLKVYTRNVFFCGDTLVVGEPLTVFPD